MTQSEDIRRAAGQILVGGFDGTEAPDALLDALRGGRLGGAIEFRRNIDSLEQLVTMNEAISAAAPDGLPALVCVDQEGGRVRRLTASHGASEIPSMRALGDIGDVDLAASVGEVIATEVSAVGFNVNFAPVLDVDTNPDNPIIGDRSFGRDPERVAKMAGAVMTGHLIAGVIPCGKHFPGHGDTAVDSHLGLPVVSHDLDRLQNVELVPFQRLINGRIPMIMSAHIVMPALDPERPATLSRAVMTGLLRERMRFEGVVVSDDLEMAAIAARWPAPEAVLMGLRAGVDLFLICRRTDWWQEAWEAVVRAAEAESTLRERLLDASARVVALKRTHLLRPGGRARFERHPDWRAFVATDAHRAVLGRVLSGNGSRSG